MMIMMMIVIAIVAITIKRMRTKIFWCLMLFSLGPGRTVHCTNGSSPPQNPGQKSDQNPAGPPGTDRRTKKVWKTTYVSLFFLMLNAPNPLDPF